MKKQLVMTTAALLAALALPLVSSAEEVEQDQAAAPEAKENIVVQKSLVIGPDGKLMEVEGGEDLEAFLKGADLPPEVKKMLEQFGKSGQMGQLMKIGGVQDLEALLKDAELPPEVKKMLGQFGNNGQMGQLMQLGMAGQFGAPAPDVQATYLGLNCDPLGLEAAEVLGLPAGSALKIGFVAKDSPAQAAGLAQGDVITHLNDQLLINPEQLAVLVRTFAADETVSLKVIRGGEKRTVDATLASKMLPALGPGGANLSRGWRLEQTKPGEFTIPLGAENPPQQIEKLVEQFGAAGLPLLQLDGNAQPDEIKELITDMLMQQNMQADMIDQIREALDLNLGEMLEQAQNNAGNGVAGTMQLAWAGQGQQIKVMVKDNGTHLTAEDKNGEVLFDGPVPEDGDFGDLPKELQDKLNTSRVGNKIDLLKMIPFEIKPN